MIKKAKIIVSIMLDGCIGIKHHNIVVNKFSQDGLLRGTGAQAGSNIFFRRADWLNVK